MFLVTEVLPLLLGSLHVGKCIWIVNNMTFDSLYDVCNLVI